MVARQSRLAWSRSLLSAVLILFLGFHGSQATAQVSLYEQTLNVVSFGGSYTRSQMLAYVRPWEKITGKAVNMIDYGGGIAEITAQVESANVKWDVVDMELSDLIAACDRGLLRKVEPSLMMFGSDGTPASDDIPADYMQECGYPSVVWSTVIVYNQDAFANAPSTAADFFNVADYPGKRGVRRTPKGLLEWALMSDGVAASDVYSVLSTPQGVERAFEIASELKPHIVWWSSGGEPAAHLASGLVTMSTAWNGRVYDPIVKDGQPIGIIWDQQMLEVEYWAILEETPRLDNARDFIRFATQTESMALQSRYIPYGPVRKSSEAYLTDDIKPYLPTSHLDGAVRVDSQFWAANMDEIGAVFEEWIKPKTSDIDRAVRF